MYESITAAAVSYQGICYAEGAQLNESYTKQFQYVVSPRTIHRTNGTLCILVLGCVHYSSRLRLLQTFT